MVFKATLVVEYGRVGGGTWATRHIKSATGKHMVRCACFVGALPAETMSQSVLSEMRGQKQREDDEHSQTPCMKGYS
eukprot:6041721-Pleurochrysis_carterae.AAC.1